MAQYSEAARDAAVDWFQRLQNPQTGETVWTEFTAWLEAEPEHRAAYEAVEGVWLGVEPLPEAEVVAFPRSRPRPPAAAPRRAAAIAAAILAVALLGAAGLAYVMLKPAPEVVYATGPGEVRTIDLADGSRVILDRGSTLKVALDRRQRRVELIGGEADFSVAHDPTRPFLVKAGDRRIQVVGTQFDVLREPARLQVTVSEGQVAVGPSEGPTVDFRLRPGDQLDERPGRDAIVRKVDVSEPAGWRNGMLVYRDAPLQDVAADLSRYLAAPIRIDKETGAIRFSGVLRIADGAAMLDRLEAFVEVEAVQDSNGLQIRKRPG